MGLPPLSRGKVVYIVVAGTLYLTYIGFLVAGVQDSYRNPLTIISLGSGTITAPALVGVYPASCQFAFADPEANRTGLRFIHGVTPQCGKQHLPGANASHVTENPGGHEADALIRIAEPGAELVQLRRINRVTTASAHRPQLTPVL